MSGDLPTKLNQKDFLLVLTGGTGSFESQKLSKAEIMIIMNYLHQIVDGDLIIEGIRPGVEPKPWYAVIHAMQYLEVIYRIACNDKLRGCLKDGIKKQEQDEVRERRGSFVSYSQHNADNINKNLYVHKLVGRARDSMASPAKMLYYMIMYNICRAIDCENLAQSKNSIIAETQTALNAWLTTMKKDPYYNETVEKFEKLWHEGYLEIGPPSGPGKSAKFLA